MHDRAMHDGRRAASQARACNVPEAEHDVSTEDPPKQDPPRQWICEIHPERKFRLINPTKIHPSRDFQNLPRQNLPRRRVELDPHRHGFGSRGDSHGWNQGQECKVSVHVRADS